MNESLRAPCGARVHCKTPRFSGRWRRACGAELGAAGLGCGRGGRRRKLRPWPRQRHVGELAGRLRVRRGGERRHFGGPRGRRREAHQRRVVHVGCAPAWRGSCVPAGSAAARRRRAAESAAVCKAGVGAWIGAASSARAAPRAWPRRAWPRQERHGGRGGGCGPWCGERRGVRIAVHRRVGAGSCPWRACRSSRARRRTASRRLFLAGADDRRRSALTAPGRSLSSDDGLTPLAAGSKAGSL